MVLVDSINQHIQAVGEFTRSFITKAQASLELSNQEKEQLHAYEKTNNAFLQALKTAKSFPKKSDYRVELEVTQETLQILQQNFTHRNKPRR